MATIIAYSATLLGASGRGRDHPRVNISTNTDDSLGGFCRRVTELANQTLLVHGSDLVERNLAPLALECNCGARGLGSFNSRDHSHNDGTSTPPAGPRPPADSPGPLLSIKLVGRRRLGPQRIGRSEPAALKAAFHPWVLGPFRFIEFSHSAFASASRRRFGMCATMGRWADRRKRYDELYRAHLPKPANISNQLGELGGISPCFWPWRRLHSSGGIQKIPTSSDLQLISLPLSLRFLSRSYPT